MANSSLLALVLVVAAVLNRLVKTSPCHLGREEANNKRLRLGRPRSVLIPLLLVIVNAPPRRTIYLSEARHCALVLVVFQSSPRSRSPRRGAFKSTQSLQARLWDDQLLYPAHTAWVVPKTHPGQDTPFLNAPLIYLDKFLRKGQVTCLHPEVVHRSIIPKRPVLFALALPVQAYSLSAVSLVFAAPRPSPSLESVGFRSDCSRHGPPGPCL